MVYNEATKGLNWLAGFTENSSVSWPGNRVQADVAARVEELVHSGSRPCDAPSQETALRELLKGRSLYDGQDGDTSLASFKLNLVALPRKDEVEGSPLISSVVPPECLPYLRDGYQRMLRTEDEYNTVAAEAPIKPYNDPALRRNYRGYVRLIRRLVDLDMLFFTLQADEEAGLFLFARRTAASG